MQEILWGFRLPPTLQSSYSNKMKLTKTQITLGITIILLLVAGGYILDKEYIEPKLDSYYRQGSADTYFQLVNELSQCKQVPLQLNENQTVTAVLIECLNQ